MLMGMNIPRTILLHQFPSLVAQTFRHRWVFNSRSALSALLRTLFKPFFFFNLSSHSLPFQYSFPAWQAGIILGLVIGFGGGLGTLNSGLVVRKLDLKPPGMAIHVIVVRCFYVLCLITMMFLTSDGVSAQWVEWL